MTPENEIAIEPPAVERVGMELSRFFGTNNFETRPKEIEKLREVGNHVDWARAVPFLLMHAICLSVIWVGFSWVALATMIAMYFVRMFAITGFYHRYFSHRTFKTSRVGQFVFGLLGALRRAAQPHFGGPRITGIITSIPTRWTMCIPRCSMDFSGAIWAGSSRTSISLRICRGSRIC